MTAPTVTHLPTPPSRLSKPSSFITDSTVFLESLSTFRTELNWLSYYINSTTQNKYNFGRLDGIRSFPTIYQVGDYTIEYTGSSVGFTSDLDIFYDALTQYNGVVNQVGVWFDSVIEEVGVATYDLDKPIISGVTSPMNRSQSREDFNETASLFGQTVTDYINSLYQSVYYTYITSCGNKDYGSITDTTIIKTIFGGSITDTNITY